MDNINVANTNHANTSAAVGSSHSSASPTQLDSVGERNFSDSKESFHDSIKKAFDNSKQSDKTLDNEPLDDELSGNNMPIPNVLAALDDRPLPQDGVSAQSKTSAENMTLAQKGILHSQLSLSKTDTVSNNITVESSELSPQLAIDENVSADEALNVRSSPLKPLLKMPSGKSSTAIDGLKPVDSGIAKTSVQSAVTSVLSTEQSESLTIKNETLITTAITNTVLTSSAGQQQTLPNIQASLLQAASTQVDADAGGLPLVTNTTINSFSATSLQSMSQAEIPQALGRPGWSQAMGKQVLMMVNQNIGTAEIRLNPAHLGPVEILIDMSEDQVNVSMSSRHAVVREAMEQALPRLREMLDEKGLNLADTDISKHSFAQQREQNAENNKNALDPGTSDQSITAGVSDQVIHQVSIPDGMVDYYI